MANTLKIYEVLLPCETALSITESYSTCIQAHSQKIDSHMLHLFLEYFADSPLKKNPTGRPEEQ